MSRIKRNWLYRVVTGVTSSDPVIQIICLVVGEKEIIDSNSKRPILWAPLKIKNLISNDNLRIVFIL